MVVLNVKRERSVMKVYAVEQKEDDFYADYQLVKLFQRKGDAVRYCNERVLAEIEESGEYEGVSVRTGSDLFEVYSVVAEKSGQTLKLTSKGEFYRPEVLQCSSEFRVVLTDVE